MKEYFISGKFYKNGSDGEKVLTGYFSSTAESDMNAGQTLDAMIKAACKQFSADESECCVENFHTI